MVRLFFILTRSTFCTFLFLILSTASLFSSSLNKNNINISNAVIHKPFPGAKSAAGYMILENNGGKEALLTGVAMPLGHTMIHETVVNDRGVVKMKHLMKLSIPRKTSISFEPGGFHIMIMGLDRTLKIGEKIPAKINFKSMSEEDFTIDIFFTVMRELKNVRPDGKSKHNH